MSPQQPLHNANGKVSPYNDESIRDTDGLIRRVTRHHIVSDVKCASGRRVSSMLFEYSTEPNGGISVDLEREMLAARIDAKVFISHQPYVGAVRLEAGAARNLGLQVGRDPLVENPYHGEIWGRPLTRGQRKQLLNSSRWFVEVPDVTL